MRVSNEGKYLGKTIPVYRTYVDTMVVKDEGGWASANTNMRRGISPASLFFELLTGVPA